MEISRARSLLEAERVRLERWLAELEAEHTDLDSDGVGELSTIDQHVADAASDTFERDRVASLLATARSALAEVDDAVSRLEHGRYAHCASCGEVIPDERLEAVPATRFCTRHQGFWEGSRLLLDPPKGPMPADVGADIEELMMGRSGGRPSALPDDDELGETETGIVRQELANDETLQEDRHVR